MKLNLKSVLTGSAATVALLAASSANASGYYIGLFGGISTMEDSFDVATSTSGVSKTVGSAGTYNGLYFSATLGNKPTSQTFSYTYQVKYSASGAATGYNKYTSTNTFGGTTKFHRDYRYTAFATGVKTSSRATLLAAQNSFDDGWVVGAAVGWNFGNGWRTELEAAYRQHDVAGTAGIAGSRTYKSSSFYSLSFKHSDNTGGFGGTYSTTNTYLFGTYTNGANVTSYATFTGPANFDADLETWSFMANLWYDFDFGDSPIHPFIGGGIGFANASLEYDLMATLPSGTQFGGGTLSYRGNGEATDWGFAYQVGAGLGYDLGNGMMLSAQYRYFNTGAMDLSLADQIEVNLESHNFLVGLNIPLGGGM